MPEFLRATAKIPPSFSFDGRHIREGDEIACNSRMMAETLLKIGCFERVEHVNAVDVTTLTTAAKDYLTETVEPQPKKRGRPRKGQYARRDMRAGA